MGSTEVGVGSVFVAVGGGVFVAGGRTVLVDGGLVGDAGIKTAVLVAAGTICTTLVLVGDRGVKACVAYWEEVIGINATTPANVPESSATQQSIERSL